jgi:hypothetical protein
MVTTGISSVGCSAGDAAPFAITPQDDAAPTEVSASSGETEARLRPVPLPAGVRRQDLMQPSAEVRRKLDAALAAVADRAGDVIVFVDPEGRAILPDAERAAASQASGLAAAPPPNELSFTYNSPDSPWVGGELASVQGWVASCYPHIKTVYGPPAFAITVNIRKAASGTFAGTYSPSTNELTLANLNGPVVCHELIHAFHDDYIFGLSSWEEGFTRAAEIEVTRRAGIPNQNDHTYSYDIHYQELNLPTVGARGGGIAFSGWSQTLVRYQLAGYAWSKAFLEAGSTFTSFNAAYYARAAADLSVPNREAALWQLFASAKPSVENLPFSTWYPRQFVLGTNPPTGDFVFVRAVEPSNLTAALFTRDANGNEFNLQGQNVSWWVTDTTGAAIASGADTTTSTGIVSIVAPISGTGRHKVFARATINSALKSSSGFIKAPEGSGVFGVVVGADSGSITLTPLDVAVSPVTVPVSQGAFDAPSLNAVRGRVRYVFTNGALSTPAQVFTKDDAPYYLNVAFGKTLTPTADAYVRDGASASQNFGSAADLGVQAASSGGNRIAYLKFTLPAAATAVARATLRLQGSRSVSAGVGDAAYAVATTNWSETDINWNNKPVLGAKQGTSRVVGTAQAFTEWDVTSHVQAQASGATLSLAVQMDASSTSLDTFRSREATFSQPELVVVYAQDDAPSIATAPSASPSPVTGTSATLSVLGADDRGESALRYTWSSVGFAPAPVTFSANGSNAAKTTTATFSAAGSYDFQVVVTDAAQQSTTAYLSVPVTLAPSVALPARIQAESYVRYFDTTAGNTGGACGAGDVDKEATADNGGVCNVGWTQPGEWLEYDVSVATAQNLKLVARAASGAASATFHIELDGVNVSGALNAASGGWQTFVDRVVPSVAFSAGNHVLRVVFDAADVNLNYLDIALAGPSGVAIPARIEAESYVRYFDTTAGNTGGACGAGDVDKEATADNGGVCNVGWTVPGEWLEYDITSPTTRSYTVVTRVASNVAARTYHLELDGVNVSGTLTAPNAGWQAFADRSSTFSIPAGNHRLRVAFDTGDLNVNYLNIQ